MVGMIKRGVIPMPTTILSSAKDLQYRIQSAQVRPLPSVSPTLLLAVVPDSFPPPRPRRLVVAPALGHRERGRVLRSRGSDRAAVPVHQDQDLPERQA